MIWTSFDGTKTALKNLSDSHLQNIELHAKTYNLNSYNSIIKELSKRNLPLITETTPFEKNGVLFIWDFKINNIVEFNKK